MRNQRVIIKIENPCDKPWSEMTLNERGKFCDHCAKTVVDFTKYTNSELAEKFSSNSESMCGRFRKEQLNKVVATERQRSMFSPSKYLAGLFLFAASKNVSASTALTLNSTITANAQNAKEDSQNRSPKDSLSKVIEGVVMNEIGEFYPWIKIEMPEAHILTVTDIDGKFKLVIPDSVDLQYVYISAEGHDVLPERILIDRSKNTSKIEIRLNSSTDLTEIGLFYPVKKRKWWQFWKKKYE